MNPRSNHKPDVELTDTLMHPDDQERLRVLHEKLRAGQDAYEFEYRTIWAGKTRWIAARGTVLDRSPEGPTRLVGVAWDITQIKETHAAMLAAEERLRLATETAGMFAWEIDLVGHKMHWAENAALIIGCPQHSLTERPEDGAFFVLPEDRPKILHAFEDAQKHGDTYTLEYRGLDPQSDRAFWRVNGKFLRDASGRVERAIGVTENITRQKRFENTLRVSAERFAATEAAAGTLSYDTDIKNGTVWRSGGLTRLLGWTLDEIPATPEGWTALKHPDDRLATSNKNTEQFVASGDHYSLEYRVAHKDGHYVWVMDSGRVFRASSGEITRYLGSTIDISARKEAEQSLRRKASLIELSFEPIFVWRPEHGIVDWNKGAEQLYGFSREEALGRQSHALLMSQHPVPWAEIMNQLRKDGSWSGELRQTTKTGEEIFVESRHQTMELQGEIFILETNHDITERKRAEAGTARMAAVASASQDALFGAKLDGEIEAWNPAAERLFGYSADEIIGQDISLLAGDSLNAEQLRITDKVKAGETAGPLETRRLHKSGVSFMASLSVAPVRAADGSVTGMAATVRDISDRKEWEARQLLMSRELAHRVKNSFAVLQSILRSTLKSSSDPEQFAVAFSSRVHSLSVAQDALTDNDWKGAELGDLARRQLGPYMSRVHNKIDIQGPAIRLPPEFAVPFSMIFNELASNAQKHGALSVHAGTVALSWTIVLAADKPRRLIVRWEEHGKDISQTPGPDAYGAKLIDKSLAGAVVTREYRPDGLDCTIAVNLG
jgi:PAS domain S-box-containing protein